MRVFRFENQDGKGMYGVHYLDMDTIRRPPPWNDSLMMYYSIKHYHYFGFLDLDQALSWISPDDSYDWKMLATYGCGLSEYEASDHDFILGETQIVFDKYNSRRICWIPLKELT